MAVIKTKKQIEALVDKIAAITSKINSNKYASEDLRIIKSQARVESYNDKSNLAFKQKFEDACNQLDKLSDENESYRKDREPLKVELTNLRMSGPRSDTEKIMDEFYKIQVRENETRQRTDISEDEKKDKLESLIKESNILTAQLQRV